MPVFYICSSSSAVMLVTDGSLTITKEMFMAPLPIEAFSIWLTRLYFLTQTVYEPTGHHQTSPFPSSLHVSQHAPLVDVWVVSLHAGMSSAAIKAPGDIDHICRGPNNTE